MYDTTGHLLIGYDQELFSLIGKIGSRYTWYKSITPEEGEGMPQEYAFGIDASIRPLDGLEIGMDAYGTTFVDSAGDPMFSAKVTYDIPIYKTLYIQPFTSLDTQITTQGTNMEIAGGINMPWPGGGWMEDPIYILGGIDTGSRNGGTPNAFRGEGRYTKQNTFGGITIGGSFYIPDGEDPEAAGYTGETIGMIDISIFEARGDEGLYQNLGLTLTTQVYNLLETIEFGIAMYIDYEILDDTFLSFFAIQYQDYDQDNPSGLIIPKDNLNLQVGIQYIQIKNATIGIEYGSGNLLVDEDVDGDEPEWGVVYAFLSLTY